MIQFNDCTVLDAFVAKSGNTDTLFVYLDKKCSHSPDWIYQKAGCFYFYQGIDGYTHFVSHSEEIFLTEEIRNGLPVYRTAKWDGFGGLLFKFKVQLEQLVYVDVIGPYSSGCYAANAILPSPAIEIVIYNKGSWFCGAYLAISVAQAIIDKYDPAWKITDTLNYKCIGTPKGGSLEKWTKG